MLRVAKAAFLFEPFLLEVLVVGGGVEIPLFVFFPLLLQVALESSEVALKIVLVGGPVLVHPILNPRSRRTLVIVLKAVLNISIYKTILMAALTTVLNHTLCSILYYSIGLYKII